MSADNSTVLVGNLVEDPELRFTTSGAAVVNFRIAVTPRINTNGEWKDGETSFFKITAWRAMAENVTESFSKGSRVVVIGRLRQRQWETTEGEKRQGVEVEAEEVAASVKFGSTTFEKAGPAAKKSTDQFTDEPPF